MAEKKPLVWYDDTKKVEFMRSGDTAPSTGGASSAWTLVKKTAIETRTSNATLAADSVLQFSMVNGASYSLRIRIFYNTEATPDFKYGFNGPTAGFISASRYAVMPGATAGTISATATAYDITGIPLAGNAGRGYIEMDVAITGVTASGTFTFTWAQNTLTAANTSVLAGSYIEYTTL